MVLNILKNINILCKLLNINELNITIMKKSYREILEKRIILMVKEYDKLHKAYYKQRKAFHIWLFCITLLYSVILLIIINNLKN